MILVTGGAGFIGANFVLDWLAASDEPVLNLDKLTYAGNLDNLASLDGDARHLFVRGDIGDTDLLTKLLAEHQPRAVINFAAESHVDRSILGPGEFIDTNVVGTFKLLEAVRAYWSGLGDEGKAAFRFLHVSTDEVYGSLEADDPAFAETNAYQPNSPYSASKAASDHLVRAYHHTYGLPVLFTPKATELIAPGDTVLVLTQIGTGVAPVITPNGSYPPGFLLASLPAFAAVPCDPGPPEPFPIARFDRLASSARWIPSKLDDHPGPGGRLVAAG